MTVLCPLLKKWTKMSRQKFTLSLSGFTTLFEDKVVRSYQICVSSYLCPVLPSSLRTKFSEVANTRATARLPQVRSQEGGHFASSRSDGLHIPTPPGRISTSATPTAPHSGSFRTEVYTANVGYNFVRYTSGQG
jgi:hypothetical protein